MKRCLTALIVGFPWIGYVGSVGADDLTKPPTRLSRDLAELTSPTLAAGSTPRWRLSEAQSW
jgi:hypothetical protein